MEHVVVVGAGQAGVQAAFSIRDEGFRGRLSLIGEEAETPYQRPPLSKAYLLGKIEPAGLHLKDASLYEAYGIELGRGVHVEDIDLGAQRLHTASAASLSFDHLILATGSRQRRLGVPGEQLEGVHALRSLADAKRLRAELGSASRAVVVGAGFIGLEFAAVARVLGVDVTILELANRPLARAISPEMSHYLSTRHVEWGSRFLFDVRVAALHGKAGRVSSVELEGGDRLEADLVLVGVGVAPNDELARAAGLDVGDGVIVDATLATSNPNISAIGDCARHPSPFSRAESVRVESVQNAADQARCVAARLCGRPENYAALPWFWSDQGDIKLQLAGLSSGCDASVVRGDVSTGAFSVFCFREGRLLAVETVNRGAEHIMARRLVAAGASLTQEDAANEATPLKTHLNAAAGTPR